MIVEPIGYRAVRDCSFELFANACRAARPAGSPREDLVFQLGAWSLTHGLASLLVEGRLGEMIPVLLGSKPKARLSESDIEKLAAKVLDMLAVPATR